MAKTSGTSLARLVVVLASLVIVVAGMRAAAELIVPFLCALFLTVISGPALRWLRQRGVPAAAALLIVLAAMVVLVALVLVVVGSSLAGFQSDFDTYARRLEGLQAHALEWLHARFDITGREIDQALDARVLLRFARDALGQLGSLMSNALLILLLLAFLLAEAGTFAAKLQRAAADPDAAAARVQQMSDSVNRYFSIKTLVSLLTGVLAGVLLSICGVAHAALWAFLAFLLNFVPNIGSFLAAIPPLLLTLIQPELGLATAAAVAVGFTAINLVVGAWLEPRLMGRGLDLSSLVVFVSLLFWGWVLGPIGMLLSVPLTAAVKVALEAFPETEKLARMLGSTAD